MVKRGICPKCGKEGIIRTTWVKNSSKKIYYYKIYIHDNQKHFVNSSNESYNLEKSKRNEKDLLILSKLAKISYFNRKFTVKELLNDLNNNYSNINYSDVRRALDKLSHEEILIKSYNGTKLFFSLSPKIISRLFEISLFKIELIQDSIHYKYKREIYITFKNITVFPLEFYPFVIHFDMPIDLSKVSITALDAIVSNPLKILEGMIDKTTMFVYIIFDHPLTPGKDKSVKFIYETEGSPSNFYFATSYDISQLTICLSLESSKHANFYILQKGESKPLPITNYSIIEEKDGNKNRYCYNSRYSSNALIQITWS